MDKLEDYRRTIAHKHDGTEDFEEKLHSPEHSQQKRLLNTAWKGETWFKVKKDARPPRSPITTSSKALPAPSQQQEEQPRQWRRYTEKKPERLEEMATSNQQRPSGGQQPPTATSVPRPKELATTEDYWMREGHLWKRIHIKPRTALYTPQQAQDGARCHKADPREGNNHQTNIRSKMVEDRQILDNKTRSNFEHPLDWLNKL